MLKVHKIQQTRRVQIRRGAGSYLRSRRFYGFYDRPSEENCQSLENRREHAQKANITPGFRHHVCSGFAFDSIIFFLRSQYFLAAAPQTIRTNGMKGHLCQISDKFETDIFLLSVVNFSFLVACCIRKIGCYYFVVEILKLITSHLHTDDIREKISFAIILL